MRVNAIRGRLAGLGAESHIQGEFIQDGFTGSPKRGVITTPGYQTGGGYMSLPVGGGTTATPDRALSTWFSGGGVAPSTLADTIPSELKTDDGGTNWLLIAAVAAAGYFLAKK